MSRRDGGVLGHRDREDTPKCGVVDAAIIIQFTLLAPLLVPILRCCLVLLLRDESSGFIPPSRTLSLC